MRYFSKSEAEALIPRLEGVFAEIAAIMARGEAKAQAAGELESSGRDLVALEIEKSQLRGLASEVEAKLASIIELGASPKGLSPALVDFPSRIEGREAYLCWKLGDKKITHWHGLEEGFAGRKPLPPDAKA